MREHRWPIAVLFALFGSRGAAHAQEAPRAEPAPRDAEGAQMAPGSGPAPPSPGAPTAPAVPPDRARGLASEPGVEAEDVALFVPRALFFVPARLVEVVGIPIRAGLTFVQEHHVIEHVEDVLYNDARTAAIVPALSLGSNFGLQLGARAFHDDLGGNGERGFAKATWGPDTEQVYSVGFEADAIRGSPVWVETRTTFETHPRMRFFGIGDEGDRAIGGSGRDPREAATESYFRHERLFQLTTVGLATEGPEPLLRGGVRSRFKHHELDRADGLAPEERQLASAYDPGRVPGFEHGTTTIEEEAVLILDTRDERGRTGHGIYVEVFGGGALPVADYEYARFGAEVTGYLNLYRHDRVLVLRGVLDAVEGQAEEIPFVELPSLGGANRLRGYPLNRFRDEKAVVATVEYHWPIHELLAAALYVDVGQVAETFADLVDEPQIHVGGGGGLIVRDEDDVYFTLDVAGGEGLQVHFTTDPLRAFADRDDEL